MKLKKLIKKFGSNMDAKITILDVIENYSKGVEKLREERFYQENKNRKIEYVDILDEEEKPELVIALIER